jgi:diguanylate cyclase (GGDEF)-like protein/PAS domain S-box-containing protein
MAEKLGVKREELIGKLCYNVIHSAQDPPSYCPHSKSLATCKEHIEESYEEKLEGYYLFSATPLFDSAGNMKGTLEVARDITDRRTAEDALRDSEELFRSVTQSATDAIVSIDNNENIMLWNNAAETLFGYQVSEVMGKPLTMIIPERFRQAHKKGINRFLAKDKSKRLGKNYKITALKKDGREFPVELSLANWDRKGDICYTGIIRDITEHKKLEEKLRTASIRDELTGLLNRRGFLSFSRKQLEIAKRNKRNFSILYMDLNEMKTINDTFGHKEGDQALIDTAMILRKTFRASDIISRIGGDEFTVLITEPTSSDIEKTINEHLQHNLVMHNKESKRSYDISLSMGITHFDPDHPSSIDELIDMADKLMYEHKKNPLLCKEDLSLSMQRKSEKRISDRFVTRNQSVAELVISEDVRIKNISVGGICLKTSQQLTKNTLYKIKISCPDDEVIIPTGLVVWSAVRGKHTEYDHMPLHYEAGLKFLELKSRIKGILEKFITHCSN